MCGFPPLPSVILESLTEVLLGVECLFIKRGSVSGLYFFSSFFLGGGRAGENGVDIKKKHTMIRAVG